LAYQTRLSQAHRLLTTFRGGIRQRVGVLVLEAVNPWLMLQTIYHFDEVVVALLRGKTNLKSVLQFGHLLNELVPYAGGLQVVVGELVLLFNPRLDVWTAHLLEFPKGI